MFVFMKMVIDQEKSDCCNTDVSYIISIHAYVKLVIHIGDSNGNLSKVLFARIVNGSLVYEEGKDDNFVFGGKPRSLHG